MCLGEQLDGGCCIALPETDGPENVERIRFARNRLENGVAMGRGSTKVARSIAANGGFECRLQIFSFGQEPYPTDIGSKRIRVNKCGCQTVNLREIAPW